MRLVCVRVRSERNTNSINSWEEIASVFVRAVRTHIVCVVILIVRQLDNTIGALRVKSKKRIEANKVRLSRCQFFT